MLTSGGICFVAASAKASQRCRALNIHCRLGGGKPTPLASSTSKLRVVGRTEECTGSLQTIALRGMTARGSAGRSFYLAAERLLPTVEVAAAVM